MVSILVLLLPKVSPFRLCFPAMIAGGLLQAQRNPDYAELEEAHPRSLLESKDETETLWATAKRVLKPLQFEALWLRYGEDLTIEETAHVMKTNQIRVRVLVHRARGILVRHVKNESKGGIQ